MEGHAPTPEVLDYVQEHYLQRGIRVAFTVDDLVDDPTPDTGVTDADFWDIEATYNNKGDDAYGEGDTDAVYFSQC